MVYPEELASVSVSAGFPPKEVPTFLINSVRFLPPENLAIPFFLDRKET